MNIEKLKDLENDEFEKAVKLLDMKGIVWLMEAIQTTMCDEQQHFEMLSLQLQEIQDRNSYRYRKISASLCSSQRLLTSLCTKHIICCGQKSEKTMSLKKTSLLSNFNPSFAEEDYEPHDFIVHKTNFQEEEEEDEEYYQEEYIQDELEVIPEEEEEDEEDEDSVYDTCDSVSSTSSARYFKQMNTNVHINAMRLLQSMYRINKISDVVKMPSTAKEGFLGVFTGLNQKSLRRQRKYVRVKSNMLCMFETMDADEPYLRMDLKGACIESPEYNVIGVHDKGGQIYYFRCDDEDSCDSWTSLLRSHVDYKNYLEICPRPLSVNQKILILDIGSCSIRAGILMSSPSLPFLYFPTVCAKRNNKLVFGASALDYDTRDLRLPLVQPETVTKYTVDTSILPALFKYIFIQLNISPRDFKVQISLPRKLSTQNKVKIAQIILQEFNFQGLNMSHQGISALHGYKTNTGIVVDIGERVDILPIAEGYIVESGVAKHPYGGKRLVHHLKQDLATTGVSLFSDVGTFLARYVLEHLCYVAQDYQKEMRNYNRKKDDFKKAVPISQFLESPCATPEISLDVTRFKAPEGLFTPEKWGLDIPGVHQFVYQAIQQSGIDVRKDLARNVYISGGITMLPGFAKRLQEEISKLTITGITPTVYSSPYGVHMSYIGNCEIALDRKFKQCCVTRQKFEKDGLAFLQMWYT